MTERNAGFPANSGWRRRAEALLVGLERFPLAILQILFRLCIGGVFWSSGMTKIASWQTTVALFRDE